MERIAQDLRLDAARLWRNAPVRRLAYVLAAAACLALLAAWWYTAHTASRLEHDWLAQQSALLGRLAEEDPALAETWARLLAHPERLTPEDTERGRQLAVQYGLTPELGAQLSPMLRDYRARSAWMLAAGLFGLFALLALLLLRDNRRQLLEIRKLAVSLDNAIKHNQRMDFRLYEEGELGLLASSVQELAFRLQQTIEQLHRDKDFLKDTIADISHQLKTPLASLAIYVDLLQEGRVDPDTAREFLGTCRRELDRMEWLTLTLLKLARLEANALPMQIRPAPIAETVGRAEDAVARLAEERGVRIERVCERDWTTMQAPDMDTPTSQAPGTDSHLSHASDTNNSSQSPATSSPQAHSTDTDSPSPYASSPTSRTSQTPDAGLLLPHDPRWLAEAIVNLLKNAVEISPPGSTVRLTEQAAAVFWRLSVEDQGPGIAEKHMPYIFRKFHRFSSGGSGVGLGLPLAKSIVERHGGMLTASSLPEGGARFVLTLPRHPFSDSYNTVSEDPMPL